MVENLKPKLHDFAQNFMRNLYTVTLVTMKSKATFFSFECFHLSIIPNALMRISKIKTPKKTADMTLRIIIREAVHYG